VELWTTIGETAKTLVTPIGIIIGLVAILYGLLVKRMWVPGWLHEERIRALQEEADRLRVQADQLTSLSSQATRQNAEMLAIIEQLRADTLVRLDEIRRRLRRRQKSTTAGGEGRGL
jgi:RPA family protein